MAMACSHCSEPGPRTATLTGRRSADAASVPPLPASLEPAEQAERPRVTAATMAPARMRRRFICSPLLGWMMLGWMPPGCVRRQVSSAPSARRRSLARPAAEAVPDLVLDERPDVID